MDGYMDSAGGGVRFRDCEAGLTAVRLPKASCLGGWDFVPLERWPGNLTLLRGCGAWFLCLWINKQNGNFYLVNIVCLWKDFFKAQDQATGNVISILTKVLLVDGIKMIFSFFLKPPCTFQNFFFNLMWFFS